MFKWLETFQAVYNTGSFSQAAKQRFISQPSVTAQIQQLEATLGVTLFVRTDRKHIVPTPAADYLYANAKNLLQHLAQVTHDITRFADDKIQITLGASQTTANTLVPQLLPELSQNFPNIQWQITVDNSEHILAGVTAQTIDIGFIEKPLLSPDVHRRQFGHDELIHVGDVNGPWLVREAGSGVGYYTRRYWEEHNLQPQNPIEVNHSDSLLAMLKQGFGQSLISKALLPPDLPIIQQSEITRPFYLIYPHHPHPLVQQLVAHIKSD